MSKATVALPRHFEEFYPQFVRFLEIYFEWKDRRLDMRGSEGSDDYRDLIGVGSKSNNILADYTLQRSEMIITTSDNKVIALSDDSVPTIQYVDPHHLEARQNDSGLPSPSLYNIEVDDVRVLKLIQQIGQVRGSTKGVELFFRIFFNEEVTVHYPREYIMEIDGHWELDSEGHIRDDYKYDEFAYIVETQHQASKYLSILETVFKPFFHAGGFTCIIKQIGTDDEVNVSADKMKTYTPNSTQLGGGVAFIPD